MDILCLMGLFPDEYRAQIEKDSIKGMQNAANKLQWAIVRGLDQIVDVKASIVNSLYIGSYPKRYKKLMIPSFPFHHKEGANDINVGFCNLSGLKFFSRYFSARKAVVKWAKSKSDDKKVLLIYAMTTPFVNIAEYIKKKFPEIKICLVVPDLPEHMRPGKSDSKSFYSILKQREIKMLRRMLKKVDSYVLLTDAMKEWFGYPITYTVVEGIAMPTSVSTESVEKKKTILYAGGINVQYGTLDLVKSFIATGRDDWELSLYGDGSALEQIREVAKDHPNVKLHGMVPNTTVVAAQKEAAVLVNPRKNQIFTKYSFPSKILEYMSSGTPVLAYKLDGIPNEYDPYFFHIEDTENGLTNALEHVMSLTDEERADMGEKARTFVAENKNPRCQCQKIVDMLNNL